MRYEHEESFKRLLGSGKRTRTEEMERFAARAGNEVSLQSRRFSQRFNNVDIDVDNKCACM